MKIVFICSSLEPGKDGVGDYTRRLGAELIRQGHSIKLLALNDSYISDIDNNTQQMDQLKVSVLRLPSAWAMNNKLVFAKAYINDFNPDWLSLQFVIFGFHTKGLPFGLGGKLSLLGTHRHWHIMFHEIWQGESKKDSLKQIIWGKMQKGITQKIINKIKPQYCSTSNEYYKFALAKNRIATAVLPVFSNIPIGKESGKSLINNLPEHILANRDNYIIASFFGTIHYDACLFTAFNKLQQLVDESGKMLVVTHVGKADKPEDLLNYLNVNKNVYTYIYGQQAEQDIANYFCQIDIGLSTNPKFLFEKSGSISAMLNNGLPVLLLRQSYEPDNRKFAYLKEVNEVQTIADFISQKKSFGSNYGVQYAALKYQELLNM